MKPFSDLTIFSVFFHSKLAKNIAFVNNEKLDRKNLLMEIGFFCGRDKIERLSVRTMVLTSQQAFDSNTLIKKIVSKTLPYVLVLPKYHTKFFKTYTAI